MSGKGLYVFGLPIWESPDAADARREDREDRKEIKADKSVDKTYARQAGRTGRAIATGQTSAQSFFGAIPGTIGAAGDLAAGLFGGKGRSSSSSDQGATGGSGGSDVLTYVGLGVAGLVVGAAVAAAMGK